MKNKENANRILEIASGTLSCFLEKDMPVYAANATLFLLIASFPLLMLLISIISFLPMLDVSKLPAMILKAVPNISQITEMVNSVLTYLMEQSSAAVTWISALTALFSASSGVFALLKGMNRLYGNTEMNYLKSRLIAVAYTCFVLVIFVFGFGSELARQAAMGFLHSLAVTLKLQDVTLMILKILRYFKVLSIIVTFLLLLCIYAFPIQGRRSLRSQVPGALLAAFGWYISTRIFVFYITCFWKASVVYGSLTAVILISFWVYAVLCILFLGAALNKTRLEVNAACAERRKGIPEECSEQTDGRKNQ